jgi:hypothetical protein
MVHWDASSTDYALRGSENIKVPKKNITAEHAEPRRIKQFRIVVAVFCGLLRLLRFSFIMLGGTMGNSSPLGLPECF